MDLCEVREGLVGSIELAKKVGGCRGTFQNHRGEVCALGAIRNFSSRNGPRPAGWWNTFMDAAKPYPNFGVAKYNDCIAKSANPAVETLEMLLAEFDKNHPEIAPVKDNHELAST